MSEKSKRDLQWEQKKREREERLKKQREGDAGKEFPPETQQFQNKNFNNDVQQMNGFREPKKKQDQWQVNDTFEPNQNQQIDQKFAPSTQIKQSQNKSFEPNHNVVQQSQQIVSHAPPTQGFQPQSQGFAAQQQGDGAPYRKNKQFIQAQVVNQPLQVQSENIQQNKVEEDNKPQQHSDQISQKQQYGTILQQQVNKLLKQKILNKKQQQQERERQQKEIDRQNMEEERQRVELQKQQEQEKERKEQYRLQLQEQMKQKESQSQKNQQQQQFQQQQFNQQQGIILAQQFNNQPNQQMPQQQQQQQQSQSQVGVSLDFGEKAQNNNQKQEYGQFLRNQMQNKNQNMNSQIDKKALLQQQMESQQSKIQQDHVQKNNFGRKNITQMLNQEVPMNSIGGAVFPQDNMVQSSQQKQYHQVNNPQQQLVQTPQVQNDFHSQKEQNYESQNHQNKQKQDTYQIDQSGNEQTKQINVRGNRNLLMAENADITEVNKKQQQKTEYQKELERQIQEKKRQKELEIERIKKEELLEEQRIQKEQEEQKKIIEQENNAKKQKQENIQKQNEQLMDQQKKKNRRQNDNAGDNNNQKNQNNDPVSPINEFLNLEKKNEGLDSNASLMEGHRKKAPQNLQNFQSGGQTPKSSASSAQPQMNAMQGQQQFMMNQMGNKNNGMGQMPNQFMQQNPMMYGNQFMLGSFPMYNNPMSHMMMAPQLMQQQQFLAQQQAEILPQLYELRLQMQQQQLQMQQQIDLIKNQANSAVEERDKAEQKYQELKKQYEQKQQEEKKYQTDLQDALDKTQPQNKPHQQLKNNLDFITPTSGGDNIFDGPAKYHFHEEDTKPVRSFNEIGVSNMNQKPLHQMRLQSAKERGGVSSQPSINVTQFPESGNIQQKKQINSFSNLPDNNQELQTNPNKFKNEKLLADQTKQEYQHRMQQYGIKSLVSDNKFIPMDILDQVTMSKLGNYGVSGSQVNVQNQNPIQNTGNNLNRRPPSNYRQNQELGVKENHTKYDIPSINSDIIKDIDNFMQKNHLADQFNTQQSYYNVGGLKDDQKIGNENKNDINSYNPQIDNVYAQKPPSRLGSNQMRRAGREQTNPFGNAAKGILGDSKAFEQQKADQKQQNTIKTNTDQEGFYLGSDFPDFSLNNKGLNAFNRQTPQQSSNQINFRNDNHQNENNNNIFNMNTYNTNNFDLDKINEKNDERLKKLNQFNIPTNNNDTHKDRKENYTSKDRNTKDDDDFKKLDELFLRFNK